MKESFGVKIRFLKVGKTYSSYKDAKPEGTGSLIYDFTFSQFPLTKKEIKNYMLEQTPKALFQ